MACPRSPRQRKQYGLHVDPHLMREVEHLSVDQEKYLNGLTEEAFRDLLKKDGEKKGLLPNGKIGRTDSFNECAQACHA